MKFSRLFLVLFTLIITSKVCSQDEIHKVFQEGVDLYHQNRDYEAFDCFAKVDSLCRYVFDTKDIRNEYHKVYLCKIFLRIGNARGRHYSDNYGYTPIDWSKTEHMDALCNNAIQEFSRGNYSRAIEIRKKAALQQKNVLGDSSFCYINSLLFIGECYDSIKEYSRAITTYKEALNIQYRIYDSTHNDDKILNTIASLNSIYHKDSIYREAATESYIEYAQVLMRSTYHIAIFDGDIKDAEDNARIALDMIKNHYLHDSKEYLDQLYLYSGIIGLKEILLKNQTEEELENLTRERISILNDYESTCRKISYIHHKDYYEALSILSISAKEEGDSVKANNYAIRLKELIFALDPISLVDNIKFVTNLYEEGQEQYIEIVQQAQLMLDSAGMYYSDSYITLLEDCIPYYMENSPEKLIDNCLERLEIKRILSPNEVAAYAERKLLELALLVSFNNVDDKIKIKVEELRKEHHLNACGKDLEYIEILSKLGVLYVEANLISNAKKTFLEALSLMNKLQITKKQYGTLYKNLAYIADYQRNREEMDIYVEKALEGLRIIESEEDLHEYLDFLKWVATAFSLTNIEKYHNELISAYKEFKLAGVGIGGEDYAYDDEAMFTILFYRWLYGDNIGKSPEFEYYAKRLLKYYKSTNNLESNRIKLEHLVNYLSVYYSILNMNTEGIELIEYYNNRYPNRIDFRLCFQLLNLYNEENISSKAEYYYDRLARKIKEDAIPIVLYNTPSQRTIVWNEYIDYINSIESLFYPTYYDYLFVGIGIMFDKDGLSYKIIDVTPNSPADMAGIKKGDIIKQINGIHIDTTTYTSKDVRKLIAGTFGTQLGIELIDVNGVTKSLVIERNLIHGNYKGTIEDKGKILEKMYDLSLLRKNFLLMASIEFEKVITHIEDTTLLQKYKNISHKRNLFNSQDKDAISHEKYNRLLQQIEDEEFALITEVSNTNDFFTGTIVDYQQIKKSLRPGEVAMEMIHFVNHKRDMYAIIATTANSIYPFFVSQFGEDIISPMTATNHTFNEKDAELISTLIWEPLSAFVPDVQTIFFSPDGLINVIPVENKLSTSIKYPDTHFYRVSSTRQICNRKEQRDTISNVSLWGGINYGASIHEEGSSSYSSSRLVYVPMEENHVSSTYVAPLPWSKTEIDSIYEMGIKNNIHCSNYAGDDATEKKFKQLSETNVNIIHVATHGFYFNSDNQDQPTYKIVIENGPNMLEDNSMINSGLLLAGANITMNDTSHISKGEEDGLLTSYEVSSLHFSHLNLISLSACQTGWGNINNEGVFGLQRGFKKAGAKSILMSLWKVDDHATSILMTKFYEYLFEGYGKQESLLMAQEYLRNFAIEVNRNDGSSSIIKPFKKPDYWAPFVLLDAIE